MRLDYLISWLLFLIICACEIPRSNEPCPAPPCDNSLLDQVNFYTVDQLSFENFEKNALHNEHYNKTYNPSQFLDSFYLPWQFGSFFDTEDLEEIKGEFFSYEKGIAKNSPCFTGNYQEYSERYLKNIKSNIPTIEYGILSNIEYGITTGTVDLRTLPTSEFCFKSIRNAGEGYPFDYLQESTLWIGTPIAILTQSNDGQWSFVSGPYGMGWIQTQQVAIISKSQIEKIKKSEKAIITADNLILKSKTSTYTLFAGTILPLNSTGQVLIPTHSGGRQTLQLDPLESENEGVQKFPLEFNAKNVKTVLTTMLGGKYSWGGIDGGRDCSSTLKDYFGAFGIWMPRNSRKQRYSGESIDLTTAESKDNKAQTITEEGLPFLSTLYMPGHIVLYLGENQNNTMQIYHSVWGLKPYFTNSKFSRITDAREQLGLFGLRSRDNDQVETRTIIGKTVITDIEPEDNIQAMENIWVVPFLDNMETMTNPSSKM